MDDRFPISLFLLFASIRLRPREYLLFFRNLWKRFVSRLGSFHRGTSRLTYIVVYLCTRVDIHDEEIDRQFDEETSLDVPTRIRFCRELKTVKDVQRILFSSSSTWSMPRYLMCTRCFVLFTFVRLVRVIARLRCVVSTCLHLSTAFLAMLSKR